MFSSLNLILVSMLLPFGVSNQPGEFLIFSTGVVNHVIICDNVMPYNDMTTV